MADGQVLIDSKLDTGGVTKGANKIEKEFDQLAKVTRQTARIMEQELRGIDLSDTADSVEKDADRMANAMKDSADDQSDAMRKAWNKTESEARSGSRKVVDDIDDIGNKAKVAGNEIENSIGKAFSGLASKIGGIMGTVFAVEEIFEFGKQAVDLGSDLAEVQNVVDVTFGESSGEIDKFARNAIKQFGISELAAKKFTSTMGAMLKSMGGFNDAEVRDMSTTLAGLAGDMASFYNLDAEEAFNKLRSGISGETEPLKQLGINLSVANLEAFALANGIKKSYDKMTEQEKTLLRYNYLLKATADAQNDFARTQDSWANQTRILSEEFNSLKGTLGQGLINVLNPLVTSMNDNLMPALQSMADRFVEFTEGFNALDYLKTLDFEPAKKAIEDIIDTVKGIDFGPAIESAKRFGESADSLGKTIGAGLSWAWENVLVPFGTWTIEEGAPAALDALSAAFDFLSAAVEYLSPLGEALWNDFLSPLADWSGDALVTLLDEAATGFTNLATAAETSSTTAAETVIANWENAARTTETGFVVPTHEQMLGLYNDIESWFSSAADDIVNNFTTAANTLDSGFVIPTREDMETLGQLISEAFSNAADSLKEAWNTISQWFDSNVVQPIQTAIESFVSNALQAWDNLTTSFSEAWESIKQAAQNALNAIQGWINNLTGKSIDINVNKTGSGANLVSYSGYDGEAYSPAAYAVTPQIPYLATGAVIPPNAPFLAMLGDQRNGTNIEAPMDTIKQGVREVLEEMGFDVDVNINFVGELSQLIRILYPHIEVEKKRKGASLAEGVTT